MSGSGESGFSGCIGRQIASGDCDCAFSIECMSGVENQVSEDQVELGLVDEDIVESWLTIPGELNVTSCGVPQEFD